MNILKSIIEKFNLKELIGIMLITTLALTVAPVSLLSYLGLLQGVIKYKSLTSIVLIICISYFLYILIGLLVNRIKTRFWGYQSCALKYLKNEINQVEKELLIEKFYDKQTKSFLLNGVIDLSDGRQAALESKMIMYRASTISQG
ncbi:MAG: superinfection exclusion B family protein, partial [Youngiibacter sp.]|nr:superinfection exclusion B family protein [Youngiibacter sp.]